MNKNFAAAVDYVLLARRADTLAVVYSISDSVYYYTIDGERVGAMRMPADSFRLVEPVLPGERINTDMAFRKTWMESLDVVSRIVWLGDGTLVLQYRPPSVGGPGSTPCYCTSRETGRSCWKFGRRHSCRTTWPLTASISSRRTPKRPTDGSRRSSTDRRAVLQRRVKECARDAVWATTTAA
ncbi:MAG TPA: hypothetical protein VF035_05480 [Longimicrobiales bacterium]